MIYGFTVLSSAKTSFGGTYLKVMKAKNQFSQDFLAKLEVSKKT